MRRVLFASLVLIVSSTTAVGVPVRAGTSAQPSIGGLYEPVCRAADHTPPSRGAYRDRLWPGGVIPYEIDDAVSPENRQLVLDALELIESVSAVRFVPRTVEEDWFRVVNSTTGSFASIGRQGGMQTVNIQHWWIPGLIVHELMHMLGVIHEHQRPDRAPWVLVRASGSSSPSNLSRDPNAIPTGRYDYASIMHYPQAAASLTGLRTIVVSEPWRRQWQYRLGSPDMSAGDIRNLWVMYGLDLGADAPPDSFDLTDPPDDSTTASTPAFAWTASSDATTYRLLVDDDPLFRSPEIDAITPGLTLTPVGQLTPGRAYHWTVVASNAVGQAPPHPFPSRRFFVGDAPPGVIRVDPAAAPGGDGSSWASPIADLADALVLARINEALGRSTEIRLAAGLYRPDRGSGSRRMFFEIPGGTTLLGGFAGPAAPDPDHRDADLFHSVLTGDLASDDTADPASRVDNSWTLATVSFNDTPSVLDGLRFTAGFADSVRGHVIERQSAGLIVDGAAAIIRHCVFQDLHAIDGGSALYVWEDADVVVADSVFEHAMASGDSAFAPVSVIGASRARFERCRFTDNAGAMGGAIMERRSDDVGMLACTFEFNTASDRGGAIDAESITVVNSAFLRNFASRGGALAVRNAGNASIHGSLIAQNMASDQAGAIDVGRGAVLSVINATIADNLAPLGAGLVSAAPGGSAQLFNTVAWANGADAGLLAEPGASLFAAYSAVQGGAPGIAIIDADPLFADPASDDYSPLSGSPVIDAGSVSSMATDTLDADADGVISELLPLDLAGLARRTDDPGVPDSGEGGAPMVDIGAYEHSPGCPADFFSDGLLDYRDVFQFITLFGAGDPSADLIPDDSLDALDVLRFLELFAEGCPA